MVNLSSFSQPDQPLTPSFRVATSKSATKGKFEVELEVGIYSGFNNFCGKLLERCNNPVSTEKTKAGFFIRGGDLELYETYKTSGGTIYNNIYPRCDESLKSAELLIIDADKGIKDQPAPTLEVFHEALKKLKINHFGYTSSSHTPGKPKCRILIPCKMQPSQLQGSMAALQSQLKLLDVLYEAGGSEEITWSIPWFFPVSHPHQAFIQYFDGNDFRASNTRISVETDSTPEVDRSDINDLIQTIVKGEGNTGLHSATRDFAYGQIKDGVSPSTVKAVLYGLMSGYNLQDSRQKENWNKIEAAVDSAYQKFAPGSPNSWDPILPLPDSKQFYNAKPFPKEYVPPTMRQAAKELAKFSLKDEEDVLPVLVTVIAASINRKAIFTQGSQSLIKFFQLAMFCIAPTGGFKSTVFDYAMKGFKAGEKELKDAHRKGKREREQLILLLEKEIKNQSATDKNEAASVEDLVAKASKAAEFYDKLEEIEETRVPGSIVSNVTQEKAIAKCYDCGGFLTVASDEGQAIIASWTNLYNKGSNSSTDFYVSGLTGDTYDYARKSGDELNYRPCVSFLIFVQNDIYEKNFLSNDNINSSGFAARIVPHYWAPADYSKNKDKENVAINLGELKDFHDRTAHFAKFDTSGIDSTYPTDESAGDRLIMPITKVCDDTGKFQQDSIDVFNRIRQMTGASDDPNEMEEITNKCLGMAYCMASCLYAYENYEKFFTTSIHQVDRVFMNSVNALADYLIDKKLQENKVRKSSMIMMSAKMILKKILNNKSTMFPSVTYGVFINKFNNNRWSDDQANSFDKALEMLIELNYLFIDTKLVIHVHPELFKADILL